MNMKKFYFMSGLPRSGSTLLSTLLNQNPNIYSGPSSPVTGFMLAIESSANQDTLFTSYPKIQQMEKMVSSVIDFYYSDIDKPTIIDKNRSWVNRPQYIEYYFGVKPKIICPVRNLDEVVASFLSMHKRNPFEVNGKINFIDEHLIKNNIPLTDENRCRFLLGPGIIGQSYDGMKQCLQEGRNDELLFVEYDNLVNNPQETLNKIYDFLEEDRFTHNFDCLENKYKEQDSLIYGFSDMHEVRETISKISVDPKTILPSVIYEACQRAEFWRSTQDCIKPCIDKTNKINKPTENKKVHFFENQNRLIGI